MIVYLISVETQSDGSGNSDGPHRPLVSVYTTRALAIQAIIDLLYKYHDDEEYPIMEIASEYNFKYRTKRYIADEAQAETAFYKQYATLPKRTRDTQETDFHEARNAENVKLMAGEIFAIGGIRLGVGQDPYQKTLRVEQVETDPPEIETATGDWELPEPQLRHWKERR